MLSNPNIYDSLICEFSTYELFAYVSIVIISVINFFLSKIIKHYRTKQHVYTFDLESISNIKHVLFTSYLPLFILFSSYYVLNYIYSYVFFDFFAYGYVIFIIFNSTIAFHSILYFKILTNNSISSERIHIPKEFNFLNLSALYFSFGVLGFSLFAIFGEYYFAGACLFAFSTSLGCWRRARQARKKYARP